MVIGVLPRHARENGSRGLGITEEYFSLYFFTNRIALDLESVLRSGQLPTMTTGDRKFLIYISAGRLVENL